MIARDRQLAALQLELTAQTLLDLETVQAAPDSEARTKTALESAYLTAQRFGAIWAALGLLGVRPTPPVTKTSLSLEAALLNAGANLQISSAQHLTPVIKQANIAAQRLSSYAGQGLQTYAVNLRTASYAARWGTLQGVQDMADNSEAFDENGNPVELLKTWVRLAARAERRNWHDALVGTTILYSAKFELIGPNGRFRVLRPYDPSLPLVETMRCGHGIRVEPPRGATQVSVWRGGNVDDISANDGNPNSFISSKKRDVNTSPGQPMARRDIAGLPRGEALSDLIEVPPDPRFDSAREAIALVERVHGVRGLNITMGTYPLGPNTDAAYLPAEGASEKSGRIFYNPAKRVSRIAFLEEFGHALDHQAFSQLDGLASSVGNSDLEPVFGAIRASETYARIKSYTLGQTVSLLRDGRIVRQTITDGGTLVYEQSLVEWFARAYVQFIVVSTGDIALLKELATLRTSESFEMLYPNAWPEAEFEPIAFELERLLREKGWIR